MATDQPSILLTLTRTKRFTIYSIKSLRHAAVDVLCCENVFTKAQLSLQYSHAWKTGLIHQVSIPSQDDRLICPDKPGRPAFNIPSNTGKSVKSMMKQNSIEYTIHGIANAESYAVDLFWDIIARFQDRHRPRSFFEDMVTIVEQEAQHFAAWQARLDEMEIPFGIFPSNDTLWQYAMDTKDSILHRLAIINLTHEAKGLDSYFKLKEKLDKLNDTLSLLVLEHNIREELGHVACGVKWFQFFCEEDGLSPQKEYQRIYKMHFKGPLKPPFHKEFRDAAGMTEDWYWCLTEGQYV